MDREAWWGFDQRGGKELNMTERACALFTPQTHTSAIKIKGRVRGYGVLFSFNFLL